MGRMARVTCFDPVTNDLYIGDVGQDLWEMIYLGKRGANYGWSVREGTRPFHSHRVKGPGDFVDPLIEHPHSESRSITRAAWGLPIAWPSRASPCLCPAGVRRHAV